MNHLDRILPLRAKAEAYAFRLLKNRDDAADCVQLAYVRISRHEDINSNGLVNYFWRAVKNCAGDVVRARRQRAEVDIELGHQVAAPDSPEFPHIELDRFSPQDQLLLRSLIKHEGDRALVKMELGIHNSNTLRTQMLRLRKRAHRLKVVQ